MAREKPLSLFPSLYPPFQVNTDVNKSYCRGCTPTRREGNPRLDRVRSMPLSENLGQCRAVILVVANAMMMRAHTHTLSLSRVCLGASSARSSCRLVYLLIDRNDRSTDRRLPTRGFMDRIKWVTSPPWGYETYFSAT